VIVVKARTELQQRLQLQWQLPAKLQLQLQLWLKLMLQSHAQMQIWNGMEQVGWNSHISDQNGPDFLERTKSWNGPDRLVTIHHWKSVVDARDGHKVE
jgi:hypothetical protein